MKVIVLLGLLAVAFAWQSFAPGEGPFDHMTNEEFAERYLMSLDFATNDIAPPVNITEFEALHGSESEFDWRNTTLGPCIGEIRDQGNCGSCWAHATTEMMSDRLCIQNNGTYRRTFSPQYMVSCANITWGASGCQGADTQRAIQWMAQYSMVEEECYPYTSGNTTTEGKCYMYNCPSMRYWVNYDVDETSVTLYNDYRNAEMALDIKENGPIYFSMIVYDDFMTYKSGVYYPKSRTRLGAHAIKCVGWGWDAQNQSYYWICANSWTTSWGEEGFFRIGFNKDIGYKAGSAKNRSYKLNKDLISS